MSMIKCPECGVAISSKAETCIRCGYPIAKYVAAKRAQAGTQQASARAVHPSPAEGNRQPLRIEQQVAAQPNRQQAAPRAPQPSPAQGNRQPLQIEKQAAAAASRQQAPQPDHRQVPQEQKQAAHQQRHHAAQEHRHPAPRAQQAAAPAPQYAAAHSSASGGFNVKLLLVLILGILWMIMAEASNILEITYRLSPLYFVANLITPILLFCGMVLCVLKNLLNYPLRMWSFGPFWRYASAFWIIYIPAQVLEIHFFGIGYSPDNWYRRSSR